MRDFEYKTTSFGLWFPVINQPSNSPTIAIRAQGERVHSFPFDDIAQVYPSCLHNKPVKNSCLQQTSNVYRFRFRHY